MQLLRGFPWCHLNSALPPVFSIHLSACVPKHFCLMTSSLCFSQFRPLADPQVSGGFLGEQGRGACWLRREQRYDGVRDWEVSWLSCLSTTISACCSQRRAPHGQHAHTVWAGIEFWQALPARPQPDCQCACSSVDLCARVHECYCRRFPERPLEQNGQIPGIFFLILARGKVRRVSIHRHEALEAISLKTGQRSGQMTCTAEQSSFGMGAGEKETEGRRKYE